MKGLYSWNTLCRIAFLLLTPVFFQYFAIGFVWHSIYWGVVTAVVLIWSGFILLSPLVGRIGCGWFCFMGTAYDLVSPHAVRKTPWSEPKVWVRSLILVPFFLSAGAFYFLNAGRGVTHGFAMEPGFLALDFGGHYKVVWMVDVACAVILGLLLDRRWGCRNLCYMGALCAAGAKHSRLLPVVDRTKCTECGKCERDCLVRVPLMRYIRENHGLVTNAECILCGKCVESCKTDALQIRFVWNRAAYKRLHAGERGPLANPDRALGTGAAPTAPCPAAQARPRGD